MSSSTDIPLYCRATQTVQSERVFEQGTMAFIYGDSVWATVLREGVIKRRWFSKLYGYWQRRAASRKKIPNFVSSYDIDVSEVELPIDDYASFDDFFCRRLKSSARPIQGAEGNLVSPADSRLLVYPIDDGLVVPVKGREFSLDELTASSAAFDRYNGGWCMVFRLAPCDYHRFMFIDDGRQSATQQVDGFLHSVSPLSLQRMLPVFTGNYRHITQLFTNRFGTVLELDVGALVVGRIHQHCSQESEIRLGAEKGYFRFGGSTVILLFEPNRVQPDADILDYSNQGIETLVKQGEVIASLATAD